MQQMNRTDPRKKKKKKKRQDPARWGRHSFSWYGVFSLWPLDEETWKAMEKGWFDFRRKIGEIFKKESIFTLFLRIKFITNEIIFITKIIFVALVYRLHHFNDWDGHLIQRIENISFVDIHFYHDSIMHEPNVFTCCVWVYFLFDRAFIHIL